MGLFGGSSQSTGSVVSSIDFSPVIQFGEDIESGFKKSTTQTAETSPRLDDSFGVSAVVPIGSSTGSLSATTSREQTEESLEAFESQDTKLSNNALLLLGGVAIVGGYFLFKKGK